MKQKALVFLKAFVLAMLFFTNLVQANKTPVILAKNKTLPKEIKERDESLARINNLVSKLQKFVVSNAGPNGKIDFESDKKQTIKVLNLLTKPYRGLMLLKTVLAVAKFSSWSISDIVLSKFFQKVKEFSEKRCGVDELQKYTVAIFFAYFIPSITKAASQYVNEMTDVKMRTEIKQVLLEYLKQQDHEFFQSNASSVLSEKMSSASWAIPNLSRALLDWAPGASFVVLLTMIEAWLRSPAEMLLSSLWMSVSIFLGSKRATTSSKFMIKLNKVLTTASQEVGNVLSNISVVKGFANLDYEQKRTAKYLSDVVDATREQSNCELKNSFLLATNQLSYQAIILWLTLQNIKNGNVNIDQILGRLGACNKLSQSLSFLPYINTTINSSMHDFGEAMAVLLTARKVLDKPDAPTITVNRGEIVFDKVLFKYDGSEKTQFDSSFTIKPKEKIGIVGSSGGGKTTLTSLLLRFYDVASGTIKIDGQNIADVTQSSLRQNIAYVPQSATLFNRSLLENIRYGKTSASDEEVFEAAKKADLHEFIIGLPQGYQTLVGENGCKLSGGQAQRVSIARAILKNAPIMVLDEATSALDSVTEKAIQKAMDKLMENRTTLAIAHRLATIKNVDRIFVFDAGKIVGQGTHDQLLANCKVYQKLWEAQSRDAEDEFMELSKTAGKNN